MLKDFDKKEFGVVNTPPKTAEYIIQRLRPIKKNQKILDPCTGSGVFVKKLLEFGVEINQIFSYDINPYYKEDMEKLGISFKIQDTLLTLYPDSYNKFDFIVGNPPYLNKSSHYIRKHKVKLSKIYGTINAHETYAMFIVNSIWRLKEGGKLGFITSDSFLTLITHKKLRKFILNHCIINEILLAPKNLFSRQKVSTSPVIIILTKCSGSKNKRARESNTMRIIPRVSSEEEYNTPPSITKVMQKKYNSLPFNLFFSEVEDEIIELFETAPKLKEYLQGYIGMHTHNNRKYIAAVEDTELELVFRKRNEKITDLNRKYHIISKNDFDSSQWKPYLKRGGDDQYYRMIIEALDWRKESIKNYDIPINVPFEKEGIVISGVSSRLAARYMPENCYWDSNKAIGFILKDNKLSISYMLGLLNSSLYNYLAKGIINNTNSIQITGIHALPFIEPDPETQYKIKSLSNEIINGKKYNKDFNYIDVQKKIDSLLYDMYSKRFNFPSELKKKIDEKYSIYKNELINAIN